MPPAVSVIIPVLNGAAFLAEAIASVRDQGVDAEVVVVDDGSTDDSAAIAVASGALCIRQANRGPSHARNVGVEAATGDVFTFLDADDLMTPGGLPIQLHHLATHPDAGGVIGLQRYEVLGGAELPAWAVLDRVGTPEQVERPLPISVAAPQATFAAVGGFEPRLRFGEDVDWVFRARDLGVSIDVIDEVVRVRRIHGANVTYDSGAVRRSHFEVLAARATRRRAQA